MKESDLITSDGYLEYTKNNNIISFIKTDYFKIGKFNWKGKIHPDKITKNVIIGYSDYSVTDEMVKDFNLVFCINKETNMKHVYSLPFGIPNDNDDLSILKIIGDKKSIMDVYNEQHKKEFLLYMNFTKETSLNERSFVYEKFRSTTYTKIEQPDLSMEGRYNYLRNLKKSKFSLCPMGNGIETHRTWESLYMGAIPIVKYHPTYEYYEGLPILFINDWDEISEDFLEKKYKEYTNKKWNLEKLKISYWYQYIENISKQNNTL
jgi:hypothetical protein